MTILVVDDSPVMRCNVARTLEMTGIGATIVEAGVGEQGVAAAGELLPDLGITDLNMPLMTGTELVTAMPGSPRLRQIPVLVLTADHSLPRAGELLRSEAAAFLTKPVTPDALRQSVMSLPGTSR